MTAEGIEAAFARWREEDEALFEECSAIVQWIDPLTDSDRHGALMDYARSPSWDALLMLLQDEFGIGRIAREAWRALQDDLARDCWAKRWADAPYGLGRTSIARLLGCEGPAAGFATYPFRTLTDDDGESVIAAAVGCRRWHLIPDRWEHLDIEEILLWNPRLGRVTIAGDVGTRLVTPCDLSNLTVYRDGQAFFRDWAAARARFLDRYRRAPELVRESPDNELPGALLIGPVERIAWAHGGFDKLAAGPGLRRADLARAVLQSARLPQVTGAQ